MTNDDIVTFLFLLKFGTSTGFRFSEQIEKNVIDQSSPHSKQVSMFDLHFCNALSILSQ